MTNVIPLAPRRAWRERMREVEKAIAAEVELRERELATGVANSGLLRLRLVK